LIKNSQPFGKNFQKTLGKIFLTHTVDTSERAVIDREFTYCEFKGVGTAGQGGARRAMLKRQFA